VVTIMDPITYSLRADQPHSDAYYDAIATFTDEVLARVEDDCGALITAFVDFLRAAARETPRTRAEYGLELLLAGVLWRVYGRQALRLGRGPQRTLAALARWRQRGGVVKTVADVSRGVLGTLFLARNGHQSLDRSPTVAHLDRLLDWLAATAEFEQEVKRLRAWQDFWKSLQPHESRYHLAAVAALADRFAADSETVLGQYTPHVERFLKETLPGYRWREDRVFCGRQRVEYHLYMLATEVLNRAFRESFLATGRKVVLVPPCMRTKSAAECQARPSPIGEQCAGCDPQCRIHQVTKLGEKHGFAVFMLPRELSALAPSRDTQQGMAGMGIVGVSCPLTNPQGGWKTRDMNLPAQGLLLDYCGCHWHWHLDGGIPTAINLKHLLRLLGITPQRDRAERTADRQPTGTG
jgi:hypothetical protein